MATNEELVQLIQSGIDADANTEALWLQNIGIVHKIAAGYAKDSFEEEDLIQEGFFALIKAAQKFDPDCGAKFITFFTIHLTAQMRRYISKSRSSVSMSFNIAEHITKYLRIKKELQQRMAGDPSDQLLCVLMDLPMKKLQEVKAAAAAIEAQSLDSIRAGEDQNLYDKIQDPDNEIENLLDDIVFQELSGQLWKMVDELDPVEQEVIKDIYLRNKNGAEIGRDRGITRSAVSGIKIRALIKLQQNPTSKKIKMLALDLYGIGSRGTGLAAFQRTWTSATERAALKLYEQKKKTN